MSNDEDKWDFKIEEKIVKKDKKSPIKPLLNQSKKLGLDSSMTPARKSRRQLAREEGGTSIGDRDIVEAAAHWRRGLAFSIDLLLLILIIFLSIGINTLFIEIDQSITEFVGDDVVRIVPAHLGIVAVAFILHFISVLIPTSSTQKSLGKKILKLKIIGTLKPKPPLGVLIIREYIAKPIALLSIFGVLMIPLNKKRRGLHDYISGTFIIDNL